MNYLIMLLKLIINKSILIPSVTHHYCSVHNLGFTTFYEVFTSLNHDRLSTLMTCFSSPHNDSPLKASILQWFMSELTPKLLIIVHFYSVIMLQNYLKFKWFRILLQYQNWVAKEDPICILFSMKYKVKRHLDFRQRNLLN